MICSSKFMDMHVLRATCVLDNIGWTATLQVPHLRKRPGPGRIQPAEAPNMRYRRKSGQSTLSNGPGDDGTAHLCWYFGKTFIGIPHHPMAIHPDPSAVLCTYGQRRRDGRYKSPEIPALGFFFSSSPVKPSSLSPPLRPSLPLPLSPRCCHRFHHLTRPYSLQYSIPIPHGRIKAIS